MRNSFPSEEELGGMSLTRLRMLDIQEKDEEELVQKIVSAKEAKNPPIAKVFRGDFPDINSPEQEAQYQKIVNERAGITKAEVPVTEAPKPAEKTTDGVKCSECGKVLKTIAALRMHVGKFHKK